ncbi:MAG: hypothetical protein ABSA83_04985 [Verrucomicrobiota bacterium]|jgi:hypothetical protein
MRNLATIMLLGLAGVVLAGEASIPTMTISSNDVVQTSIKVWDLRGQMNGFAVKWMYTEDGAKKVRGFRDAHVGEKVREHIGCFVFDGIIRDPVNTDTARDGLWKLSERDAKLAEAGLKGK